MDEQLAWHAGTGLPQEYIAAVEAITAYFDGKPGVDALLLIASFARGKGDLALGSDCDLVLLYDSVGARYASPGFDPATELPAYEAWFAQRNQDWRLDQYGRYSGIDLELHDGRFVPKLRGWTSGPDDFELEIGNMLVYSRPVREWTDRFQRLRADWLPYYGDELRATRLVAALKYARTYPIAYDKWVEEQVSEILGRPDLYATLVRVVTIPELTAPVLTERAALLLSVLDGITPAEPGS